MEKKQRFDINKKCTETDIIKIRKVPIDNIFLRLVYVFFT